MCHNYTGIHYRNQQLTACNCVPLIHTHITSVAPILYRLSVYMYLLYWPKILVLAIGNVTKCILVTKILHLYGKIGHKIVKLCTER